MNVSGFPVFLATTFLQVQSRGWQGLSDAFRESSFTVAAISTTTGYVVPDFDLWPAMARILLLALMVMGGCAGSTAGGLKVVRIFMVAKYAWPSAPRRKSINLAAASGSSLPSTIAAPVTISTAPGSSDGKRWFSPGCDGSSSRKRRL